MDIASGLAATGNAISLIKTIREADSAYDSATLKSQLADVMSELSDAKLAQIEMVERIRELESELARLQMADEQIGELIEVNGYRYSVTGDVPRGWPACPKCLAAEKRITYLVQEGKYNSAKCPLCESQYDPVDHYHADGRSTAEIRREQRARSSAEQNAKINRLTRRNSWMNR